MIRTQRDQQAQARRQALLKLRDPDWLREQFLEKRRPVAAVAGELLVDETTVRRHLRRQRIDYRRPWGATPLPDLTEFMDLYGTKRWSLRRIGRYYNVSRKVVEGWVRRHLPRRRASTKPPTVDHAYRKAVRARCKALLVDPAWLTRVYLQERLPLRDIVEQSGCTEYLVRRYIRRHFGEIRPALMR